MGSTSLRRKLDRRDEKTWDDLTGDNGALGTFHKKIQMGYALRIYNEETRQNLDIVRAVRNAFAHTKVLIDFNHALIIKELMKVKIAKEWRKHEKELFSRLASGQSYNIRTYGMLRMNLTIHFLRKQTRLSKRATARINKRLSPRLTNQQSSSFGLMADLIGGFGPLPLPGDEPTNWLRWYHFNHPAGPKRQAPKAGSARSIPQLDPEPHNEDEE